MWRTACVVLIATLVIGSIVLTHKPAQTESDLVNIDETGLAIKGYDPVAYFVAGRPMRGDSAYEANWEGARYRFANAENLNAFLANPDKYLPSYGGFCSFGIRYGKRSTVDPENWEIVGGRLQLFISKATEAVWSQQPQEHIEAADRVWSKWASAD